MLNLQKLIAVSVSCSKKSLLYATQKLTTNTISPLNIVQRKKFSTLLLPNRQPSSLLANRSIIKISDEINSRTVTKYSIRKGKRKSVHAVLHRFYRLHWGGWIRTIAGRHRRIYTKSPQRRLRMKQHVFCNATQSTLLDKMVTNFWRRPKYYVDDPYEPYHTREECNTTYRKPKPYFPPEESA